MTIALGRSAAASAPAASFDNAPGLEAQPRPTASTSGPFSGLSRAAQSLLARGDSSGGQRHTVTVTANASAASFEYAPNLEAQQRVPTASTSGLFGGLSRAAQSLWARDDSSVGLSHGRVLSENVAAVTTPALQMESSGERELRADGIRKLLQQYFASDNRARDNQDAFSYLIEDRTRKLLERGESAETIEAVFSKARKMDWVAVFARGFVSAMVFAASGRLLDAEPVIGETIVAGLDSLPVLRDAPPSFKRGFASGVVQGEADHLWDHALAPAMLDILWLGAESKKLVHPMPEAKAAAQPSTMRSLAEHALGIQTFRGRDLLRTVMTAAGAAIGSDSWLYAGGALVAGAGYAGALHAFDEKYHRVGPEYLLGRTDWEQLYAQLKRATWSGAVANGVGRMAKTAANIPNTAASALNVATSAKGLTKSVVALGCGNGLSELAGGIVSAAMQNSTVTVAAASANATKLVVSVGVSALWTTASQVTDDCVHAARELGERIGDYTQAQVSAGVERALTASPTGTFANAYAATGRAVGTLAERIVSPFRRATAEHAPNYQTGSLLSDAQRPATGASVAARSAMEMQRGGSTNTSDYPAELLDSYFLVGDGDSDLGLEPHSDGAPR